MTGHTCSFQASHITRSTKDRSMTPLRAVAAQFATVIALYLCGCSSTSPAAPSEAASATPSGTRIQLENTVIYPNQISTKLVIHNALEVPVKLLRSDLELAVRTLRICETEELVIFNAGWSHRTPPPVKQDERLVPPHSELIEFFQITDIETLRHLRKPDAPQPNTVEVCLFYDTWHWHSGMKHSERAAVQCSTVARLQE